ncbi:hypothetical protein ACFL1X_10595 [Candidatus Hydrogenedentota bacterium]
MGRQAEGNKIYARVREPGTYGLFKDDAPPVISGIHPRHSGKVRKIPFVLSATITDKGAGIDDTTIDVHMDGRKLVCEYDPEKKKVFRQISSKLEPGQHNLSIRVSDKLGNAASKEVIFRVGRDILQSTSTK